jgi:MULE transposase domain/SWIM zinc finger
MYTKFPQILQARIPGTAVKWKFQDADEGTSTRVMKYVFWSFGPCIHSFRGCRPVLSVDGTHLRGAYKGKLLIAVCKTSNNNIMPVAFAVVDEESHPSWRWFLECLRFYVLGGRSTCIISDRDRGVISAMKTMLERHPNMGVHRFCLEHVKANLLGKARAKGLKDACQVLGTATQEHKYTKMWETIGRLSPVGETFLRGIDPVMWTLYEDGGWRWGMSTTNISESFNHSLKGARHLPIRAMVEATLEKVLRIFRRDRERILNCETALATRAMKRLNDNKERAAGHRVSQWMEGSQCFKVCTSSQNIHEVKYTEHSCSCGKWQSARFPCSHAIAVALYLGEPDLIPLVDTFYTKDTWRAQFTGKFSPILGSHTWPAVDWKLEPDESRLVHHDGPGRRRQNRFRGLMDHMRGQGRATGCTRCGETSHIARHCPLSHPREDRMY